MPVNVQTLEPKKTGMLSVADVAVMMMMVITWGDFSFWIGVS